MQPYVSRPTTLDLGTLTGPVLVFGGSYGNLEATRALIEAAGRLGISGSRAICTGDIVAYSADPQAVVDALRDWGCSIVMGNCEESLAANAADCGCGFGENSACAAWSVEWFAATRRDLGPAAKRWMGQLPRRLEFTLAAKRLAVIHGGVARINRYIFASTPAEEKAAEIDLAGADGIIAGHCGIPFTEIVGSRLWHNAGAIGQPANDGTPRVWFSILSPGVGGIEITLHALDYDHRATAAKMRARSYPAAYADSLASGLWPSCDILPPQEVAARGRALMAERTVWPAEVLPAAAD